MFPKSCKKCEALADEVKFLRGMVDRLMVQTWPRVIEPPPENTGEDISVEDGNIVERIKFGEG